MMGKLPLRYPAVAGQFYPGDRAGCIRMIEQCLPAETPPDLPAQIVAGVVPHAGWVYSGPVAAKVFAAIKSRRSPETFVLCSAVHRWPASQPVVYGRGSWRTPLGDAEVDEELAAAVLAAGEGLFDDRPRAHDGEHSAEVQVPFIQHLFPTARILPILMPPVAAAPRAGEIIGRVIQETGRDAVVIGSSDLTHYGRMYYGFAPAGTGEQALAWAKANDERVLSLILSMQAEAVVPETEAHHNACGGGAIAATVAAALVLGATQGYLLEHTNSHYIMPRGPATDFVGYAAIVF